MLVSKSSYEFIFDKLELKEIEQLTWEKAIEKRIKHCTNDFEKEVVNKNDLKKKSQRMKDYPLIVSKLNNKWIIVISDCFNDKDSAYQYCKEISNPKNQVYNFYMDYYLGYDRWIIFNEARIQKICERNDNDELRIIGQLSIQEKSVLKKKGSYYSLTDMIRLYAPTIDKISYEDIKSKTAFYGIIQSRTKDVFKKGDNIKEEIRYLNPLMNPENESKIRTKTEMNIDQKTNCEDDDLPF